MPTRTTQADADLARIARVKTRAPFQAPQIGPTLISFFKQSVQKRQAKFAQIAECWEKLVPSTLNEHCSLESYTRGTLVVIVDSSSHLYEIKQLLLAGIQQQLVLACKGAGLRKITLKPGRWYHEGSGDGPAGDRKLRF